MAIKRKYSFEGGTSGNNITTSSPLATGDGQFSTVTTTTGGTVAFDNTYAMHGSLSAKCMADNTGEYAIMEWADIFTETTGLSVRCYVYFTAAPSGDANIVTLLNTSGSNAVQLRYIASTNKLRVLNDASGTLFTTASALSTGTWYRLELVGKHGASTSTGTAKFAYYSGDALDPIETAYSSTTINAGTLNIDTVRFGHINNATTGTWWFDDLAAENGTNFLGRTPVLNSIPVTTDSNPGSWTITGGSTAHEVTADSTDGNLIQSPDAPVDDKITFRMQNLDSGNILVTVRAKANQASPVGVLTTTLKQDTTTIASWNDNLTTSWVNYTHTLTPSETANVTDRNLLYIELNADV